MKALCLASKAMEEKIRVILKDSQKLMVWYFRYFGSTFDILYCAWSVQVVLEFLKL